MVLVFQKPKQSNRQGEVGEGLPGSGKSVACVKRNTKELGRPRRFLRGARQLRQFERVLSVGAAVTSEVAEST